MKTKVEKEKLIKVSESSLLSLVADKLKDKVLFPDKVERAKNYLKGVKNSSVN